MNKDKLPRLIFNFILFIGILILVDNAETFLQKINASILFVGSIWIIISIIFDFPPLIEMIRKNRKNK